MLFYSFVVSYFTVRFYLEFWTEGLDEKIYYLFKRAEFILTLVSGDDIPFSFVKEDGLVLLLLLLPSSYIADEDIPAYVGVASFTQLESNNPQLLFRDKLLECIGLWPEEELDPILLDFWTPYILLEEEQEKKEEDDFCYWWWWYWLVLGSFWWLFCWPASFFIKLFWF